MVSIISRLIRKRSFYLLFLALLCSNFSRAQGTWSTVTSLAPDFNGGVMLLLPDGSVITKTYFGGIGATSGNTWDKLTPDSTGSYAHGTWSQIAPMINDRLYFSSWVLPDGRVFVAGGEYGAGTTAEMYDPRSNTWSAITTPGVNFLDGASQNLPDGRLLLACATGTTLNNYFFDPATGAYTTAPANIASHDEAAWLKLPDSSILQVDMFATTTERYIPSLNTWIPDATIPVALYDPYGFETGTAVLLPDGRGFFIGATGHTAFYTPSGSTAPGTWTAGPDVPGGKGAPDAPAAMLNNGKLLIAVSPPPTSSNHFPAPTSFYEFDYTTNTYTAVSAPAGGATAGIAPYITNMLNLPDGSILYTNQGNMQYYLYTPDGSPLTVGKPTVDSIIRNNCDTFTVTGKLFTGISEGSSYGDDWSMSTNFPIVKITAGSRVYYARAFNWNRIGSVMTGSLPDSVQFELPTGLAPGTYGLQIVVNGNPSAAKSFSTSFTISPSASTVCQGTSMQLSDSSATGLWSSADTSIAAIDSHTGIVTGITAGNTIITFSLGACFDTASVTVNAAPATITGTAACCQGSGTTLSTVTTGGTWSSANALIASIGSASGIVAGLAAGTIPVSYIGSNGCSTSLLLTVNPLPAAIAGSGTVCQASSTTLSNTSTGGTWTSGATTIAGINPSTGVLVGNNAGPATITYTLPTGCSITRNVTVNPLPAAITGITSACPGTTTTLSNSGGGSWSSASAGIATIGLSSGVVNGITAGTSVITYTLPTSCITTAVVTINPLPAAIGGTAIVCEASATTLTDADSGTWSSTTPAIATIDPSTGIVTANAPGTASIVYTLPTGCTTGRLVTVNPLPSAISGTPAACIGNSSTLSNTGGGTWSSSAPSTAAIGATSGIVSGLAVGTPAITYTLPSGCYRTVTFSVNPFPAAISGSSFYYLGESSTLTSASTGGSWSSSNTAIASVGASTGTVTGVAAGSATITYTLPTGCSNTFTVSVAGTPAPIAGAVAVCQSSTTTFTSTSAGGIWTSSNTSVATVGSSSGIITGIALGTATISYTIAGSSVTRSIRVDPLPATITGSGSFCMGSGITLTNGSPGGIWSSSNTAIATVGSTGIVTGLAAGVVTISYTTTCGTPATRSISVNPLPATGTITGASGLCIGGTTTLSDAAAGGVWSITSGAASIGSATGTITGLAVSGALVSYTVSNVYGCTGAATKYINVEGTPGYIYTFAGNGTNSYTGNGGPAYLATIQGPRDMATDTMGNVYFCDVTTNVIRKISATGIITTVAGNGSTGNSGDGGPATAASLSASNGIYVDNSCNIYLSNTNSHTIRKINAATGIITTIAGSPGAAGYLGDGGPATAAKLNAPLGLCGDPAGNLYIADQNNFRIRKIDPSGIISTIVGTGSNYFSGDGGPGTAARISYVRGLALDRIGNLYILDGGNSLVRKYVLSTGIVTTVAGTPGTAGSTGDGGQATAAQLYLPSRIAFDGGNNLYIADQGNNKIRMVNLKNGIINSVAGSGATGFSGDNGPAVAAHIWGPCGIACDKLGNLYIADANNRRIRVVAALGSTSIALAGPNSVPVGTPVNFTATSSICTNVTYQWQKNGTDVGTGGTQYTNPSPVNGDVYRCIQTVTPVCGSPFNDTSNTITVNVYGPRPSEPAAVVDLSGNTSLKLFPNPAHGSIKLVADGIINGDATIQVFDQFGRTVINRIIAVAGNNLSESFDINELADAIYMVTLSDASGKVYRLKFVKN